LLYKITTTDKKGQEGGCCFNFKKNWFY